MLRKRERERENERRGLEGKMLGGVKGGCARGAEESVRGEARQLPHVMILPQVSYEVTKKHHSTFSTLNGTTEIRGYIYVCTHTDIYICIFIDICL